MNDAEKNYWAFHRESLAVMFALKLFGCTSYLRRS